MPAAITASPIGAGFEQARAPSPPLPALREELLLHEAPRSHDGSPCWTLEDPGRALFFQIGWAEAEMLTRWHLGQATRVAEAVSRETALKLDAEDVAIFVRFLEHNSLVQARGPQALQRYASEAKARRGGHWMAQMLRHYLFFRVPLLHPDAFLLRTLPWVRRLFFTRGFARLTLFAGVAGLLLVARQWDAFLHTFLHFFTLEGAALAGLTLAATKMAHELGHAYVARHHGCRVASMGVAFMVMWPVLYTDTSGAWRLRVRRQRLAIGAAGMLTETALAAWATLAWSFLPDGMWRSAAFTLATTTWLLTLAVNLNPFMRFDGYFLLADALNVPNLQQRAFALARWRLREWLFGWGDEKPEVFAAWRERVLIAYAFCVWIYRFFLFLGIALLVYHMAFKLLGIVLFLVEIVAFVLRPIWTELRTWQQRLGAQAPARRWNRRTATTLGLLLVALLLAAIPWRTSVRAPALLRAAQQSHLVAPTGGRIAHIAVRPGQSVRAGAPLFTLEAPELAHELDALRRRIALLQWQNDFQAMRQDGAAGVPVARRELQAARERHTALARQSAQLHITAPFDGTVADLAQPLAEGEWVGAGEWLATLASPGEWRIEAFAGESDLHRLRSGASGRFLPEDPGAEALPVHTLDIASTATRRLSAAPELASPHGGAIASVQAPADASGHTDGDARSWVPEQAVYRVLLAPDTAAAVPQRLQIQRGTVVLEGESESLLMRTWRRVAAVFIRELGF